MNESRVLAQVNVDGKWKQVPIELSGGPWKGDSVKYQVSPEDFEKTVGSIKESLRPIARLIFKDRLSDEEVIRQAGVSLTDIRDAKKAVVRELGGATETHDLNYENWKVSPTPQSGLTRLEIRHTPGVLQLGEEAGRALWAAEILGTNRSEYARQRKKSQASVIGLLDRTLYKLRTTLHQPQLTFDDIVFSKDPANENRVLARVKAEGGWEQVPIELSGGSWKEENVKYQVSPADFEKALSSIDDRLTPVARLIYEDHLGDEEAGRRAGVSLADVRDAKKELVRALATGTRVRDLNYENWKISETPLPGLAKLEVDLSENGLRRMRVASGAAEKVKYQISPADFEAAVGKITDSLRPVARLLYEDRLSDEEAARRAQVSPSDVQAARKAIAQLIRRATKTKDLSEGNWQVSSAPVPEGLTELNVSGKLADLRERAEELIQSGIREPPIRCTQAGPAVVEGGDHSGGGGPCCRRRNENGAAFTPRVSHDPGHVPILQPRHSRRDSE